MGKRIDEIAELPASARYAFLRAMMLRYPVAAWFASDSELLDWAVKTAGLPRDASARLRRVARLAHLVYYKPFFLGIKWTLAALALAAGVLIFNAPL
jgi:hypothetical protein